MKMITRYLLIWVGLVVLAIINGAIRQETYGKLMSELSAHQLSTITGILLFGIFIWVMTGYWSIQSARQSILIGFMWLIMTILFEFVFGHLVMGHPWSKLFHDYNLLQGRVWVLVLIWTAVAPYLFYKIRNA
jgi:hypothetical protein